MFDIFKDVPDNELKIIYNDISKSEDEGISHKSLNIYAKKLEDLRRRIYKTTQIIPLI